MSASPSSLLWVLWAYEELVVSSASGVILALTGEEKDRTDLQEIKTNHKLDQRRGKSNYTKTINK